jgi:hypothetical protein
MIMSRIYGLSFLLLTTGCAVTEKAPPGDAVAAKPVREEAVASEQEVRPAPTPAAPVAPVVKPEPVANAPAAIPAPAKPVDRNGAVAAPVPKPAPAPKPESAPKPVAKPATPSAARPAPSPVAKSPPLDLEALEKRLKDTSAIGIMTKLTLKNQVDDLLERFKAHYDGRVNTTLAQLRQPYETLILKVLSALQDGDPALAKAVADSREAIWAILSDPNKFRNL